MRRLLSVSLLVLVFSLNAIADFPTVEGRATSEENSATTTHTVSLPASIASGDLLIVQFAASGEFASHTWPDGWTQLWVDNHFGLKDETRFRRADGGEGTSFDITTSTNQTSGHISYRISGHHATTDPEAGTHVGSTGDTPDPPSLTPSWGAEDTLWIALFSRGAAAADTVDGIPTNYTNGINSDEAGATLSGSAERALNASSEDPGSFTLSANARNDANTIAIRPAAAAAASPRRRVVVIQ